MSWYPFDNGNSIGQLGSEGGGIIRDEEHTSGARITLEQNCTTAPFAITCGIYGWMCHTRFFGTDTEATQEFESMKTELSKIIVTILLGTDPQAKLGTVSEAISDFVRRFP